MAVTAFVSMLRASSSGDGNITLNFPVHFVGPEVVPGHEQSQGGVIIGPGDTPQQIRTSITQGAIDAGAELGLTVSAGNVLLPTWQRGN